jgi:hypothetical protein
MCIGHECEEKIVRGFVEATSSAYLRFVSCGGRYAGCSDGEDRRLPRPGQEELLGSAL